MQPILSNIPVMDISDSMVLLIWSVLNTVICVLLVLFNTSKNNSPVLWTSPVYTAKNQYRKYKQIFQKRNCAATAPISTFMCLWAIYIFPPSICLFCCRKYCEPILGIHKSLTDTWMWNLGLRPHNPRKGIQKWDFRCSVVNAMSVLVTIQYP